MDGVPREVHNDLLDDPREHGQRPPHPGYPVDEVTTRELVEDETQVVGEKVHHKPQPVRLREHRHAKGLAK